VLIGFARGLEEALSIVLAASHYSVISIADPGRALEALAAAHVDLVVASSRCSIASVVELAESFGQPRETRVIVLLAGPDPEAERRYRAAGLRYVMHMPVHAEDLLRAARSSG
jgi:DNA-binding NtrC family response regulator